MGCVVIVARSTRAPIPPPRTPSTPPSHPVCNATSARPWPSGRLSQATRWLLSVSGPFFVFLYSYVLRFLDVFCIVCAVTLATNVVKFMRVAGSSIADSVAGLGPDFVTTSAEFTKAFGSGASGGTPPTAALHALAHTR